MKETNDSILFLKFLNEFYEVNYKEDPDYINYEPEEEEEEV